MFGRVRAELEWVWDKLDRLEAGLDRVRVGWLDDAAQVRLARIEVRLSHMMVCVHCGCPREFHGASKCVGLDRTCGCVGFHSWPVG